MVTKIAITILILAASCIQIGAQTTKSNLDDDPLCGGPNAPWCPQPNDYAANKRAWAWDATNAGCGPYGCLASGSMSHTYAGPDDAVFAP